MTIPERGEKPQTREEVIQELANIDASLHNAQSLRDFTNTRISEWLIYLQYNLAPKKRMDIEELFQIKTPSPYEVNPRAVWNDMDEDNRAAVVTEIGEIFGVDLMEVEHYPVTRMSFDKVNQPTIQDEVDVRVVPTKKQNIDIWIIDYNSQIIPTGYSIVKRENNIYRRQ